MPSTDEMIGRALAAVREFSRLDQEHTDRIVRAAYLAAMDHRVDLAKLAAEETGLGVWQDKVVKNVIGAQLVYESIKYERTAGVISHDSFRGITEVALPLGPVLAMIPIINPTSTAIFKMLICLKTRNPVILSTAPAAKRCVAEAARICYEAARAEGAPEDCMQWFKKPSMVRARELMAHRRLALVLATGTGDMVKEAQSSGNPTIGVGPGNVPVYVGLSADVPFAISSILASKTFDNGSICASEQAIVLRREIGKDVEAELRRQGAHFLNEEEAAKVGAVSWDRERRTMSPFVVGQPVSRIAKMAGIEVPDGARVLVARLREVGVDHPISAEILAPILALYVEDGFEAGIERCAEIARFGGEGHTAVIYSNDAERIEYFAKQLNVARILVNTPSTQGALGGMYNTLTPSFTLSCGAGGKNQTTDNITCRHLLNLHRICRRRDNQRWMKMDREMYLDPGIPGEEIEREFYKNT